MTAVLDLTTSTTNSHPNLEASEPPQSEPTTPEPQKIRRPRGFAAMDRKKVSEIASKGGKAAHAAGTAHQFSSDEARNAGRKGGCSARAPGPRPSQSERDVPAEGAEGGSNRMMRGPRSRGCRTELGACAGGERIATLRVVPHFRV